MPRSPSRLLSSVALVLLVAAIVAVPASGLTPQSVATVYRTPITLERFDHWMRVAAISSRHPTVPKRGSRRWKGLRDQVTTFLVSSRWLEGEARLRHIFVTRAAVARMLRRTRDESFPSRRAFARFLRKSGMTLADLLYRVKLDALSNRIRASVLHSVHGSRAKQRALDAFVADFQKRWRAKTVCAKPYAVAAYCGSVV